MTTSRALVRTLTLTFLLFAPRAFAQERRQAGLQAAENAMAQERNDTSCHIDPYGCPRNCQPGTFGMGLVSMADGTCREMTAAEKKSVRRIAARDQFSAEDKAAIAKRNAELKKLTAEQERREKLEAEKRSAEEEDFKKNGPKDPDYQAVFAVWIDSDEIKFRPFATEKPSEHKKVDKSKAGLQMKVACAWAAKFQEETGASLYGITNDGVGDYCVHADEGGFCEQPAFMQRVRLISCKKRKIATETIEINGESDPSEDASDAKRNSEQIIRESSFKGGEAWPPNNLFTAETAGMSEEMLFRERLAFESPNYAAIVAVLPQEAKVNLKAFPIDPSSLDKWRSNGNTGFQIKNACAWAIEHKARLIGITEGNRGSWCRYEREGVCQEFGLTQRIRDIACVKKTVESEETEVDSKSVEQ